MIVLNKAKLPIKIWMDQESLGLQSGAIDQAINLANHPFTEKWVCLMPDGHQGFGMPIGGVMLTKDAVLPYTVGNDIGCGVKTMKLDIEADSITREQLQAWREGVHARVPVGNAQRKEALPWAEAKCYDPLYGEFTNGARSIIEGTFLAKGQYQLGTLGSGNHFIELQRWPDGKLGLMIHSGSRVMGGEVCAHYMKIAKKLMEDFRITLPDKDLAYLPMSLPVARHYLTDMHWCMGYAKGNRDVMSEEAIEALEEALGREVFRPEFEFDCHHNFAQMENHGGKNYLVTRKGAVQAKKGQWVAIPGSMGTATYIGKGLGNPDSFETCSHGAGRIASRKKANEMVTHEQAVESMKHVVYGTRHGSYDEHPHAYKNIDVCMANQSELVEPYARLEPLAVVKG